MIKQLPPKQEMYHALINRNSQYEGIFVVGVKTTGIFCRPTCPARKPRKKMWNFSQHPSKRWMQAIALANDAILCRLKIKRRSECVQF